VLNTDYFLVFEYICTHIYKKKTFELKMKKVSLSNTCISSWWWKQGNDNTSADWLHFPCV